MEGGAPGPALVTSLEQAGMRVEVRGPWSYRVVARRVVASDAARAVNDVAQVLVRAGLTRMVAVVAIPY